MKHERKIAAVVAAGLAGLALFPKQQQPLPEVKPAEPPASSAKDLPPVPARKPASAASAAKPAIAASPPQAKHDDSCTPAYLTKPMQALWEKARTSYGAEAYEAFNLFASKLPEKSDGTKFTDAGVREDEYKSTLSRTALEAAGDYLRIALDPKNEGKTAFEALEKMRSALTETAYYTSALGTLAAKEAEAVAMDSLCATTGTCGSHKDIAPLIPKHALLAIPRYVEEFKTAAAKTTLARGERDASDLHDRIVHAMETAGIDYSEQNVRQHTGMTMDYMKVTAATAPRQPLFDVTPLASSWAEKAERNSVSARICRD